MKAFLKKLVIAILTLEARLVLKRYRPKIIAVTGSVGKTSAKDAIYTALAETHFIRKNEKTLNTDIGVPLTILGQPNGWSDPVKWMITIFEGCMLLVIKNEYPKWLVVEVGADRPGDIQAIASWLKPDIAVITAIPDVPVHVEYFNSPEQVLEEKQTLVDNLRSDGVLITNGDDFGAEKLRERFRGNVVSYGFLPTNDVVASSDAIAIHKGMPVGMRFRAQYEGVTVPVSIEGSIGRAHVYAGLAALAVAGAVGLEMVSAGESLNAHMGPRSRMRTLSGIKDTMIIDDSYNSSPAAVAVALDTLDSIQAKGRKIVVLGDMLEIGVYAAEEHKKVGKHAARVADILITVGVRARGIASAALNAGMSPKHILQYEGDEAVRAGKELEQMLEPKDTILVKGSQSMRLERTVKEIMKEPLRAGELLVRQEEEWLAR